MASCKRDLSSRGGFGGEGNESDDIEMRDSRDRGYEQPEAMRVDRLRIKRDRTEMYINTNNEGRYQYPREFQVDITKSGVNGSGNNNNNQQHTGSNNEKEGNYQNQQQRLIELNSIANVSISGVPDGISPQANEALMSKNSILRLYIFSDRPLSEETLSTIDSFYGKEHYPVLLCDTANMRLQNEYPKNNFYMCQGVPSLVSEFVEYRYLQQRHTQSNICYDQQTGDVYKLVLPFRPLLVIVMPKNFVRTGLKSGYFRFENNLIVRVYSRFILSSPYFDGNDSGETTVFNLERATLKSAVEKFMGRLGVHRIDSHTREHIYGYDKFLTMVVGSVANILLPGT